MRTRLFCVLGGGGIAPSEAVQIGGKSLGSIYDIVKTATGSDFPEIPKHSLLIFERHPNGSRFRFKSSIVLLNNDGSARKTFGDLVHYDLGYSPVDTSTGVIQKMDLAISRQPFGNRRNLVYANSGMDTTSDGLYGYQTLQSNGTETTANISTPNNDFFWIIKRQIWGVASLQIKGFENKDVFVTAHTNKMDDTNGDFYFKFFTLDRNATGYVGRNTLSAEGGNSGNTYDSNNGWKVWGYGHGVLGCEIAACDIDGDGYKNEIALTWSQSGGSWVYVYRVTKSGNGVKLTQLKEDYFHHNDDEYDNMGYHQACPNVVVGDFDADGRDEVAFVGRVFYYHTNSMRVHILDYDGRDWHSEESDIHTDIGDGGAHASCQATRCDFDGDGKDEIAILFFPEQGAGITYPRLERWYCDNGQSLLSATPLT